jgi:hypothetical protein
LTATSIEPIAALAADWLVALPRTRLAPERAAQAAAAFPAGP